MLNEETWLWTWVLTWVRVSYFAWSTFVSFSANFSKLNEWVCTSAWKLVNKTCRYLETAHKQQAKGWIMYLQRITRRCSNGLSFNFTSHLPSFSLYLPFSFPLPSLCPLSHSMSLYLCFSFTKCATAEIEAYRGWDH